MKLENKIAIVTGGGKGIGASISNAFTNEGAKVIVADIDIQSANQLVETLREKGAEAASEKVDVANPESINTMIQSVMNDFGQIDILVNNAGARIIKGLMQHTLDDWNQMIQINLTAPFIISQAVIPHMVKRNTGNIINIASIASFMGRPNRCAYVAAKTGILGLTRAMASDLAGKNIRVNAIAPGMIASSFNQSFAQSSDTGPAWAQENLIGRWGEPDDIAGAAVFLASEDSSFMTGTEIKIEGGWLGARSRSGEVPLWD